MGSFSFVASRPAVDHPKQATGNSSEIPLGMAGSQKRCSRAGQTASPVPSFTGASRRGRKSSQATSSDPCSFPLLRGDASLSPRFGRASKGKPKGDRKAMPSLQGRLLWGERVPLEGIPKVSEGE